MDIPEAPAALYPEVTFTTSASSCIQPREGDLRLNSDIIPVFESRRLCFMDKHVREKAGAFSNSEIETSSFRSATSFTLSASIVSNIVGIENKLLLNNSTPGI